MTQELYQKAMRFAGEKHSQQKVPGTGANYLLHLANVSMEILIALKQTDDFDLELAIQVAILHDVIEDTDTTFEEVKVNFGTQVASGVLALTKNDKLTSKTAKMQDSLKRINLQPKEVGMVKLADRITNLQAPPAHWSKEKIAAYLKEAKAIAESLINKNDYLQERLLGKIEAYGRYL
jgi:(p)ppGpp synthase/HD superfamily hydrolase